MRGYKKTAFFTRDQVLVWKDVWLSDKDKAPNPIFNAMIICRRQKNVLKFICNTKHDLDIAKW